MTIENGLQSKIKKSRKSKKNKKICFDAEIIKKDAAEELLMRQSSADTKSASENVACSKNSEDLTFKKPNGTNETTKKTKKSKKNKKTCLESEFVTKDTVKELPRESDAATAECPRKLKKARKGKEKPHMKSLNGNVENAENGEDIIPENSSNANDTTRKKKKRSANEIDKESNVNDDEHIDTKSTEVAAKTEESVRAKKRRKYAELLKNKKMQTELALQQKSLNYLSLWKHNRNEWKFEKLRQIWLIQNMYDNVKVPDEFWDILVAYFSNSKGKIKDVLINDAVKTIEELGDKDEEEISDEIKIKLTRSKSIVQNIQ